MRTPTRTGPVASWAAMHALGGATLIWMVTAPLGWVVAKTTIPPLIDRGPGGAIPVALLVPLLTAAAATFAAHHESPQLTQTASRPLVAPRILWACLCVAPGAVISAMAATRSNQIDIAAAERNVLLLTAITYTASRWLPPGLSTLPAFGYAVACYAAAGQWLLRGLPAPWWAALLHRQGTPTELAVSAGLLAVTIGITVWDRDRHGT